MVRPLYLPIVLFALSSCSLENKIAAPATLATTAEGERQAYASSVESLIPPARLASIKAALPKVAFPRLGEILSSDQTLWYDHEVMEPTYQDSMGAQSNTTWPNLVAASEDVIGGLHDRSKKRWQFPFATTAGTDRATNIKVVNFMALPHENGRPLGIPIWTVLRNANRPQWMWVYPNGTVFGEMIFVTSGADILPSEIRTRTRYASGWATNAFRPFPTAASLAMAVKAKRADWISKPNLSRMIQHLENPATMTAKTLAAKAALAETFQQQGALDTLPDFEDPALVKELLTTTTFVSAYETPWKESGAQKTYAASTASAVSIVPTNYEAGMFEVNEQSCMRCHKESGRLVSDFYDGLYLYGEIWGKDGIFSFHPFDESQYPNLRAGGDNRRVNPKLKQMGVFVDYKAGTHVPPAYPARVDP